MVGKGSHQWIDLQNQNSSDIGINGLRVQFTGMPSDGDVVRVSSYESAAESISVAITDSRKLATGDLLVSLTGATILQGLLPV